MTKEQYLNLKQELKDLAVKIRETKSNHKNNQRAFSKQERNYGTRNSYFDGDINSTTWESIRPDWSRLYKEQLNSLEEVEKLRYEYRYKHIVYCFARGRTLEEIEPKNKKGNKADSFKIKEMMKKYEVRYPLRLEVVA